jgi:hypothetical protein
MNSPLSTRRRVRAINAELSSGSTYAIFRSNTRADARITRASGDHGELCVRTLATGKWITTTPEEHIEIQDAAGRVYANYQGGAA